ncbi:MAG: WbqC family protein [Bacteroidales bacterium]
MNRKIVLSTAYLPPIEYFAHIKEADEVLIEREENYIKQSYRNRCYILSANKLQHLTVPVYLGSFHKTHIRDIRIDYSKRWQQVHLRALTSSYCSSPYFIYYFETFEKIIMADHEFLLDLNLELIEAAMKMLDLDRRISYTSEFMVSRDNNDDFRYAISPKIKSSYPWKKYIQVFSSGEGFVPGLSIADLLFNEGPDSSEYL